MYNLLDDLTTHTGVRSVLEREVPLLDVIKWLKSEMYKKKKQDRTN
jgi:hypothetical protein